MVVVVVKLAAGNKTKPLRCATCFFLPLCLQSVLETGSTLLQDKGPNLGQGSYSHIIIDDRRSLLPQVGTRCTS